MGRDADPGWKEGKEGWGVGVLGAQEDPCEEAKGWDGALLEGKASSGPLDRGLKDEPPACCELLLC